MNHLKILLFFVSALLITNGCTSTTGKQREVLKKEPGDEVIHNSFTIKRGGSQEECIELLPGMVFTYEYESSNSVDFNVHYHGEDKIHYPVHEKEVTEGSGMIDPKTHAYYTPEQEFYCLMWDNLTFEPVKVSFTCVLKKQ